MSKKLPPNQYHGGEYLVVDSATELSKLVRDRTDPSLPPPQEKRSNGYTVRELKAKLVMRPTFTDEVEYLARPLTAREDE